MIMHQVLRTSMTFGWEFRPEYCAFLYLGSELYDRSCKLHGFVDPTQSFVVSKLLKGIIFIWKAQGVPQ